MDAIDQLETHFLAILDFVLHKEYIWLNMLPANKSVVDIDDRE